MATFLRLSPLALLWLLQPAATAQPEWTILKQEQGRFPERRTGEKIDQWRDRERFQQEAERTFPLTLPGPGFLRARVVPAAGGSWPSPDHQALAYVIIPHDPAAGPGGPQVRMRLVPNQEVPFKAGGPCAVNVLQNQRALGGELVFFPSDWRLTVEFRKESEPGEAARALGSAGEPPKAVEVPPIAMGRPPAPQSAPAARTESWRQWFPPRLDPRFQPYVARYGPFGLILLGLLFCLLGQRWLRLLFGVAGFIIGAYMGHVATAYILGREPAIYLQLAGTLLGGVAGAALSVLLFWLGLFGLGAGLGGAICLFILMAAENLPLSPVHFRDPRLLVELLTTEQVLLVGGAAFLGGLLALWLRVLLVILSTAFGGAFLVLVGALRCFEWGRQEIERAASRPAELSRDSWVLLGVWILLGVAGVFFQFRGHARRKAAACPRGAGAGAAPAEAAGKHRDFPRA